MRTVRLPELTADPAWFPPPASAMHSPDGLLAFGGDLSVARLTTAYQHGIFPWFSDGDPLLWWSPATRAVFKPGALQAGRSLRRFHAQHSFTFSVDLAFAEVISACAAPRPHQPATWITNEIQQAYLQLHQAGLAHSLEVWLDNKLVGGLYGLQIGQLFCGESMFNRLPNTAKLALVQLQRQLESCCDGWIDCQLPNPFLLQCGSNPVKRPQYLQLLAQLRQQPVDAQLWHPGPRDSLIDVR